MSERPKRGARTNLSASELLQQADSDEGELTVLRASRREGGSSVQVRVWWPPTRDKERTCYSGAFWPAAVVGRGKAHFTVRYDNGEEERVNCENIFPPGAPVGFGEEIEELQVGEFVEVSNGSDTDPCAWLGCVSEVHAGGYVVKYPFHDAPDEAIKRPLIRRARIWDGDEWKLIEPGQTWEPGEVASPKELSLIEEPAYLQRLLAGALILKHEAGEPSNAAKPSRRKGMARRA